MRAAVLRQGSMVVRDDVPEPEPVFGQVLVQVRACGICGSDLHFVEHAATMLALTDELGGGLDLDLGQDVFMGHEFAAEVLEVGPDTQGPAPGTVVTSVPALLSMTGVEQLVYSNRFTAGYGERMLLSAPMLLEVPNGLDARHAALTEPMAVGVHAVNRADVAPGDGAVVLGCGPVGLAVIAALRLRGVEPIVAADYSPARRALATTMGAHEVVDPGDDDAFAVWARVGGARPLVAFDAIGVPGILESALRAAPLRTRIVVVGVCMVRDTVTPYFGVVKELDVRFSMAYDPMEFESTLRLIAEGDLDVAPLITGEVDLDGVPGAFAELASPERHCKILVVPA